MPVVIIDWPDDALGGKLCSQRDKILYYLLSGKLRLVCIMLGIEIFHEDHWNN